VAFSTAATKFAVGGVTAGMLLDALSPQFAEAQQVPKDDKRLKTESSSIRRRRATRARRAATWYGPANASGKLPGILVVHENRGLNPHIEDIARRLALDNFMAFAPGRPGAARRLSRRRGQGAAALPAARSAKMREDFVAAANWLKSRPDCTGKIGAVGFCFGGGIVNMLATRLPDLAAGVPFYGNQPSAEDAAKIKAPLLIHYAETDERINAGGRRMKPR
jgi:carboxymethylenebutenolidase